MSDGLLDCVVIGAPCGKISRCGYFAIEWSDESVAEDERRYQESVARMRKNPDWLETAPGVFWRKTSIGPDR